MYVSEATPGGNFSPNAISIYIIYIVFILKKHDRYDSFLILLCKLELPAQKYANLKKIKF